MTAWPHNSPLLSSTAVPSVHKTSDYYGHVTPSHNRNKHKVFSKIRLFRGFCSLRFQFNSGEVLLAISAKYSPLGISLRKLRSFSRPVTHLYARATSCLLEASTQLANWASAHTLKLN